MREVSRRRLYLVAAAVGGALCSSTFGVGYTWNLGTGLAGNWTTAGNWTPAGGPPIAGDTVTYGSAGTFTTLLTGTTAADSITLTAGTVNLRSNLSPTVRTLNLLTGGSDLTVGGVSTLNVGLASQPVVMNVGDDVFIGNGGAANSNVIVDGASNALNITNASANALLTLGLNGGTGVLSYRNGASGDLLGTANIAVSGVASTRGTLNIESGSTVTMDVANVATSTSAAEGTINVTGIGSALLVNDALTLGNTGTTGLGTLNVGTGATVTLNTTGHVINKTGRIIQTGGTISFQAGFDLIGGLINVTGGTFDFGLNGSLNDQNISQGGIMNLAGTQTLDGTLFVSGTGSQFNSTGTLNITGSNGYLRYSGSATGTLGNVTLSNLGFLEVTSGAVTTASLSIGDALSRGSVEVTNTLSSLTMTGASTLSINSDSVDSIFNGMRVSGGTLTTGTGAITVANGEFLATSGTVNANGNMSINNGGELDIRASPAFNLASGRSLTVSGTGVASILGTRTFANNTITISGTSVNTLGAGGNVITFSGGSALNVTTTGAGEVTASSLIFAPTSTGTVNGGKLSVANLDVSGASTFFTSTNSGTVNVSGQTFIANGATVREQAGGQVNLNGPLSMFAASNLLLPNGDNAVQGQWYITSSTISMGGRLEAVNAHNVYAFNSAITAASLETYGGATYDLAQDSVLTLNSSTGANIGFNGTGGVNMLLENSDMVLSAANAFLNIGSTSAASSQAVTVRASAKAVIASPITFVSASTNPVLVHLTGESAMSGDQLSITGSNATVKVESASTLTMNSILLQNSGRITLDGGTINAQAFNILGGSNGFDWVSGTVNLAPVPSVALGGNSALGSVLTLGIGKTLDVNGTLELPANTALHLDGGILEFTNLVRSGGQLVLDSGTLATEGASLSVGAGTAIGSQLTLKPGLSIVAPQITNNGLVIGSGTASARLLNDVAGEVRVDLLDTARFVTTHPSGHTNLGRIVLNGGRLDLNAQLSNGPQGDITGRGTLVSTHLDNAGDVALSSGISDIYGDVTNLSGARILLSGNADVTFWGDVTNNAGATLRVSTGSSASFFGTYSGGSITGGGQVFFEADVTPGFSPALIAIGGDVRFSEMSTLVAEINGAARGAQYDAIDVAGAATLTGQLSYPIAPAYDPAYGVKHNILHASTLIGLFQPTPVTQLSATKWLVVLYDSTNVYIAAALPGDANVDGTVGFDDLLVLAQNYNLSSGQIWQTGDFQGNGAVGFDDLLVLAQNYGSALVSAEQAGLLPAAFAADWALARTLVPEPGTLGIAGAMAAMALRRRRD